jgi:hypothetical protein
MTLARQPDSASPIAGTAGFERPHIQRLPVFVKAMQRPDMPPPSAAVLARSMPAITSRTPIGHDGLAGHCGTCRAMAGTATPPYASRSSESLPALPKDYGQ